MNPRPQLLAVQYGALQGEAIERLESLGVVVVEVPRVDQIQWVDRQEMGADTTGRWGMFEIVVREIKSVPTMVQEYQKVSDTGNEKDRGPVYAYVNVEKTKQVEVDVYRQTVDRLNLVSVIAAVNAMERPVSIPAKVEVEDTHG